MLLTLLLPASPARVQTNSLDNFAVTWEDDQGSNGSYQIHARDFNANGTQHFTNITVNSVADGQQRTPPSP